VAIGVSGGIDQVAVIAFGDFRLYPSRHLLERNGSPLSLGGRALHLLIALAERAGEIVTKRELIETVWPDVTVEEGSLRFHMVALRKALGEDQREQRFVATVPGRGYSFVAPIGRQSQNRMAEPIADDADDRSSLPPPLAQMIGRDSAVAEVAALVADHDVVSIIGAGGIGKTTVGIAVSHEMLVNFAGAAAFVELAALGDSMLVPTAVASAVGLRVQAHDVGRILVGYLRDHPTLLILDNCEHLIEGVAQLVDQIRAEAPGTKILITSREALRVESERVYRLSTLELPWDDLPLSAETIMQFPATRLFVERVSAQDSNFVLRDEDAPLVTDICRKLDGLALAIELAASRVQPFGLAELADMLGGRMRLLWRGRRTAPARQHTLAATLDWSYNLLTDVERLVLDRFSVFVGACGLDAVLAVIPDAKLDSSDALETIVGLVDKSLITAQATAKGRRYYLLQTTREYLRGRVASSEDDREVSRRHAVYYRDLLAQIPTGKTQGERGFSLFGEQLGNVRSALEWSFSPDGDTTLGVGLAAVAGWVFQELALLNECEAWCRRALDTLGPLPSGSREEMQLQAAQGLSMMFTRGNSGQVREALARAVELAEKWDDGHCELQVLGRLNTFETRVCNFAAAVTSARRSEIVAQRLGDPGAIAMSRWMLGVSMHGGGDQGGAKFYCETAVGPSPDSERLNTRYLSFDYQLRALNALGRSLWLNGKSRRGLHIVRRGIEISQEMGDPLARNINTMYSPPVFMWQEDWDTAEELNDWQIAHAEKHGWGPYWAVGMGLRGELEIRRGQIGQGISTLTICLERLRAERQYIWLGTFLAALAEGLLEQGEVDKANAATTEAIEQYERDGPTWFTPEVYRIAARAAAARDGGECAAEALLGQALEKSREQSALAWELRAATDLAALWQRRGQLEQGLELLRPLYLRYEPEDVTPDLRRAARLLKELGWLSPCGGGLGLPLILKPIEL
jgi:predicted ATPase/DNA-binding winged helix-turn-helix (wHTH) protein